ncbi:uncharacterized protein BJX67DRAFT_105213 [Aspergillus lucknowensis]|uniref:Uncharacterized protein n=1 Tax=Aspergillus lucknowensis TaxID=176173 RepID=A0ABR4LRI1_9EURO
MSSNNSSDGALTGGQPPRIGVSWQVDIPNLMTILAAIGIAGMKKLQLSGIHLDTIGYLLKLGEITPCTIQYRLQLHEARKMQRARYWFHAVVEYGTGNNFVVDELLRTRSGENALALLTAVVSAFDNMASEVLTLLFQRLFPSPENAPGIDELQRIRSLCLPLVRRMDFKDRLAEIHAWLVSDYAPTVQFQGKEALPDSATMADLVKILFDIIQNSGNRLIFYGIKGAAWLITYSWKVLGLEICVVRRDGHVHSFEGSYSSASVVVYPDVTKEFEIYHPINKVLDIVKSSTHSPKSHELNWVVSCDEEGVDFFQLCCGWDMKDRQEIGNLIYSIAKEYVELRIMEEHSKVVPVSFFSHHSATILGRLEQTLHCLGLRNQLRYNKNWRTDNFSLLFVGGLEKYDLQLKIFSTMYQHVEESTMSCSHTTLQARDMKHLSSFCIRCRLCNVVQGLSYTSALLAFTDWCLGFKKISMLRSYIGGSAPSKNSFRCFQWIYHNSIYPADEETSSEARPKELHLDRGALACELCKICSGSQQDVEIIDSNKDRFVAIKLDGALFIDHGASEINLQPGPIFMIREGEFSLGGDRRSLLTVSPHSIISQAKYQSYDDLEYLQPVNGFKGASMLVEASLTTDAIQLQYFFVVKNSKQTINYSVNPRCAFHGLRFLKVTLSCGHSFDDPIRVSKVCIGDGPNPIRWWKDDMENLWRIVDTPGGQPKDDEGIRSGNHPPLFYYHPIANNSTAQWTAVSGVHPLIPWPGIMLLQDDTCLACTRDQALQLFSLSPNIPRMAMILSYCSN